MKVLIDLDRALAENKISSEEHVRLKALAGGQTSDLALAILIGFGIIAVAIGFLTLSQSLYAAPIAGGLLAAGGAGLILRGGARWQLLGQILLVVGTVMLSGGLIVLDDFSRRAILYAVVLLGGAAILAENGLLAALTVLALSSAIGAATSYGHARYTFMVERPAETIAVFTVLGIGLVLAAKALPTRYERLALMAARVSALLVNLAFLVGSLFGDKIFGRSVSDVPFVIGWAVMLIAVAVWAWRENRRWPLITATVFGAIHFYTQWFERIGAEPAAIMFAGLAAIAIGYGLKQVLATMRPDASPPEAIA